MSQDIASLDEEMLALENWLKANCQVKTYFGRKDFAADELPIVQLLPGKGEINAMDRRLTTVNQPIELVINAAREPSAMLQAYRIAWRIIRNLPRFNAEKGHKLTEEISPVYGDNNFLLTLGFNLKLRAHGTDDGPATVA